MRIYLFECAQIHLARLRTFTLCFSSRPHLDLLPRSREPFTFCSPLCLLTQNCTISKHAMPQIQIKSRNSAPIKNIHILCTILIAARNLCAIVCVCVLWVAQRAPNKYDRLNVNIYRISCDENYTSTSACYPWNKPQNSNALICKK